MATEVERLVVALEAKVTNFEKALNRANGVANQRAKAIEDRFAKMNKNVSKSFSFGNLGGGLAKIGIGLGVAESINQAKQYADAWIEANNRVAASSAVAGRQGRSVSDINKIATATRSGLNETVDLYTKLLRATKDVAKSEEEVAQATEIINKSFKAGGAAASEQAAGVLQLSQALSSGLLQGDELRSIRENAPLIAQAIANEFKTTIGGLKQLGADGKLTVDRVFKAILDAKPMIDKAFGATTATMADGFTLLGNAVEEAVGKLNESTGASEGVISILGNLAKAIQEVSGAMQALSDSKVGKFVAELEALYGKIVAIGPAIGAATGLDQVGASLGATDEQRASRAAYLAAQEVQAAKDRAKAIVDAKKAIDDTFSRVVPIMKANPQYFSKEMLDRIEELRQQIRDGTKDADAARIAIAELFDGQRTTSTLSKRFEPLIDKLKEVTAAAKTAASAVSEIAVQSTEDPRKFDTSGKPLGDLLSQESADARRTELEKRVDAEAKKIIAASGAIGSAMTEAAAKIQAAKNIAAEDMAKAADAASGSALDLIKQFEGFRTKAYYDVNHYRVGYGSDTTTDASGRVSTVTSGTVVSLAEADRDLLRRIGDTQQAIRDKIGADTFNSLDASQQAALTSIAYNYGTLPQRIVEALKSGNQATVVQAIRALGNDNGGVNRARRNTEADIFLGGAPSGVKTEVKNQDSVAASIKDIEARTAAINAQTAAQAALNPLINDYGYAAEKASILQELLNDAERNGITVTPELKAHYEQLADGMAKAEAASNKLAESQGKLQESLSQSSAFGKDVLGGFIRDLRDGKSATEALAGALDKVADKLLDLALQGLFDGTGKPGSGAGIAGGIFSWLFAKDGGTVWSGDARAGGAPARMASGGRVRGQGGPRDDKVLTLLSNGEHVTNAAAAAKYGPLLDAINNDTLGMAPNMRGPSIGRKGGGEETVNIVLQDDSGRMAEIADQQIHTRSGTIINIATKRSVQAVRGQMPGLMSNAQARSL